MNGEIIDFKQVNKDGDTPLIVAFNKQKNLNLNKEQLDYLIQNSDFKKVNINGTTPLILALISNQEEKLNLSKDQWKYMIDNSDLSLIIHKEQLMELKKYNQNC